MFKIIIDNAGIFITIFLGVTILFLKDIYKDKVNIRIYINNYIKILIGNFILLLIYFYFFN